MLVVIECGHGDRRVHVIGRAHDHRIDLVAHLVEQLPIVAELRGVGMLGPRLVELVRIYVADGHDDRLGVRGNFAEVVGTHPAHADGSDVELFK